MTPKPPSKLFGKPVRLGASAYTPLHALAAGAVLVYAVFAGGFAAFLKNFLHGSEAVMTPRDLLLSLCASVGLFGGVLLVMKISELLSGKPRAPRNAAAAPEPMEAAASLVFALKAFVPILGAALLVNFLWSEILIKLVGAPPANQELVRCIAEGNYPLWGRCTLFLCVLLQAPLLEEPLFRGVIFRGLAARLAPGAAMAISGLLFAFVHVNAATLPALWFLGCAFAWIYAHTGRLRAAILAHFLFNLFNLVVLLIFPEAA